MDSVPFDFCERVIGTCKCCRSPLCPNCSEIEFADPKWIFPKKSLIRFEIRLVNGRWKYGFEFLSQLDEFLSSDQVKQHAEFRNSQINQIWVSEQLRLVDNEFQDVEEEKDLVKLLKFVFFMANEPFLEFHCSSRKMEGSAVVKWLEKMSFSFICISEYRKLCDQLIKTQFDSRRPPDIKISRVIGRGLGALIQAGHVGQLHVLDDYSFSRDVLTGFVERFRETPLANVDIKASFNESLKRRLDAMVEEGLCEQSGAKYVFSTESHSLVVKRTRENQKFKWIISSCTD